MSEKRCAKCGVVKPFSDFSKAKKGDRFGLRSRCKPCRSAQNLLWNQKNSERVADALKAWRENNADHVIAYRKEWYNKNTEKISERFSRWRKSNLSRRTAAQSARRAAQMQATPSWLSVIEVAQIEEFYEICACVTMQTGVQHHVDHIVPLKGDGVRGLHVPWNLQIITAKENSSKKNRMIEVAI